MEILEREEDILEAERIRKDVIKVRFQLGFYEKQIRNEDNNPKWICLPSSQLSQQLPTLLRKWNIKVIRKEKKTLFTRLPTQHEKTDKLGCREVV
ncbi:unnamed protein product [Protopolystoma xenopodis]|uniref:Uncharacterized protein n=1 Tax=Protopolystoma xenopodis TaxID=117903 RepID=A0A3S5BWX0_9PLAT|nr:unnamed protein product [Protopolystoma xenopodis]